MMIRLSNLRNISGYSLIELMIVMSIVGILASLAVPSYKRHVIKAREVSLKENLYQMRRSIDAYYADHAVYPGSLEDLVEAHYLRSIPVDPFTDKNDSWKTVAPTAALTPEGGSSDTPEGGIYDVFSGSDRIGLEGVPYSEY